MGATTMLGGGLTFAVRLGNAIVAYAAYLGMTLWPARLAVFLSLHPGPSDVANRRLRRADPGHYGGGDGRVPAGCGAALPGGRLVPVPGNAPCRCSAWFRWVPIDGRSLHLHSFLIGVFLAAVWGVADLAQRHGGSCPHVRGRALQHELRSRKRHMCRRSCDPAGLLVNDQPASGGLLDRQRIALPPALAVTADNPVAREGLGDALLPREECRSRGRVPPRAAARCGALSPDSPASWPRP